MSWSWSRVVLAFVVSAVVGAVVGGLGSLALGAAGYENGGIPLAAVAGSVAGIIVVGGFGGRTGAS